MSLEDDFGFVEDRSTPSRPVEAGPTILQTKVPETLRAIANRLPAEVQVERFNLLGIAQWIEDGRYEEWFREESAVPTLPPTDTTVTPMFGLSESKERDIRESLEEWRANKMEPDFAIQCIFAEALWKVRERATGTPKGEIWDK